MIASVSNARAKVRLKLKMMDINLTTRKLSFQRNTDQLKDDGHKLNGSADYDERTVEVAT